MQAFLPVELPYTLGWDVAGTVAEVDPGARGFAVGDRVIGRLDDAGGAAQYVRAPVATLVAAPASLPLAHATASARSAAAVRRQGADEVVDYTAGPVGGALDGPVDTLLNLVPLSPPDSAALASLVRPGGRIVSIATPLEPPAASGVSAMHMVARNDPAQLAALVALVDAGTVTVDISASRPLSDLADVHRLGEAGRIRGKVVLVP
ncbi:zinc-binding dehydrogenase [Streptomyces sp. NBC_00503]|uniref:zinc-binding dehydrogenase n=1 Tax=Streptomyces sp. NBC_00503 TaxID=2903659 RepID=UPI003FCE7C06